MIEHIKIQNYKSIHELDLPLTALNVLIGSNGAGKSNFISFFELVKAIYEQRLAGYTMQKGGFERFLHNGLKGSKMLSGLIDFENKNALAFVLRPTNNGVGYIEELSDFFNKNATTDKQYVEKWNKHKWDANVQESTLRDSRTWRAGYLKEFLETFDVYHFHDTSASSALRSDCKIDDNRRLRADGSNLAAYLYLLQETEEKAFRLIEGTIHSVAPYFKRFTLRNNPISQGKIRLEWEQVDSDIYLDAHSFSDGTIRFIALATLLLQPNLPKIIIIDEPELGLHPAAIRMLAALIKRASKKSQVIISTQSVGLVDYFDVENIITVDRKEGQSVFTHLSSRDLSVWMDEYDYSIGDLWETNMIGGQI